MVLLRQQQTDGVDMITLVVCVLLIVLRWSSAAGTSKLLSGYNPATWMLEVTGGAMATLTPANKSVDWPDAYLASQLFMENANTAQALIEEVSSTLLYILLDIPGSKQRAVRSAISSVQGIIVNTYHRLLQL